jgi:hypothetical protein
MEAEIYRFLFELTLAEQNQAEREVDSLRQSLVSQLGSEHWSSEVVGQLKLADDYQAEAASKMEAVKIRRKGDILRGWRSAQKRLVSSQESILLAQSYLEEVIERSQDELK